MLTPRSPRAVATRASEPGRSSSLTVNQTVTGHLLLWLAMVPRRTGRAAGPADAVRCRPCPPRSAKTPTRKMPDIQVFGRDDSAATRAALRFFRERRVVVHYVDLRKRGIAPGELDRFTRAARRRGPARPDVARRIATRASAHLSLDEAGIVARLLADPRLLRLPLARHGNEVTVGPGRGDLDAPGSDLAARPDGRPADHDAGDDQDGPDDRPDAVVVHEAGAADDPRPWPIHDQPRRRARTTAMIQRVRIGTSGWHPSPMDEMTPGRPRRAGRLWVTPKAAGMLEGDGRARPRTRSSSSARPSAAFLETDPWRALRILSEFVEGFDAMAKVGPAVTVFGSARTTRGRPDVRAGPDRSAGGWPRPATRSSPAADRARWRRPTAAATRAAACRSAATSSCRTSRA